MVLPKLRKPSPPLVMRLLSSTIGVGEHPVCFDDIWRLHSFLSNNPDGVPRHILFVTEQLEDYRAVIKYCQQQQLFDSHKIVLWGSGLAGT
jgi:hypothetical protein